MAPHELAARSAASRTLRSLARAAELRRLLDRGEGLKRAAWKVGVNERTARDYRSWTA